MTSHDPTRVGKTMSQDASSRATELFDRASAGVDHGMAFRLRRARQEAQQPRPGIRTAPGLVPIGAFAVAVLAAGVSWWALQPAGDQPAAGATMALSSTEIDALVVEEDAELYAWLADAPVAIASKGPNL